jgi:hypothetical protein
VGFTTIFNQFVVLFVNPFRLKNVRSIDTTDFPGRYPGRPPHLHVRVTAPGHRTLVTQVYPQKTQTALSVDFVLVPE